MFCSNYKKYLKDTSRKTRSGCLWASEREGSVSLTYLRLSAAVSDDLYVRYFALISIIITVLSDSGMHFS